MLLEGPVPPNRLQSQGRKGKVWGSSVLPPCTFPLCPRPGSWGSVLEAEMGVSLALGPPPGAARSPAWPGTVVSQVPGRRGGRRRAGGGGGGVRCEGKGGLGPMESSTRSQWACGAGCVPASAVHTATVERRSSRLGLGSPVVPDPSQPPWISERLRTSHPTASRGGSHV